MATTQTRNEELVREYIEAVNDHDFDAVAGYYADGYTETVTRVTGEELELDAEGLTELWSEYLAAFPDLSAEIHELVADDGWVLCRIEYHGTHEGEFWGLEPTGTEVEVQEHCSYRIEDGDIVETHYTLDNVALMRQLGLDLPVEL